MHHIDVFAPRAGAFQRVYRRRKKPLGDKAVESADHNAEAQSRCAQSSFDLAGLEFLLHR